MDTISPKHQPLTHGNAFAEFVMTRVRQALTEILLDTYTLEFDAFGQSLLSELEYACQRGLRVCCLINAKGSQNFIHDHPALFTKLETQIRLHHSLAREDTRLVFDRRLAVVGSHTLCEQTMEGTLDDGHVSRVFSGPAVAEIADAFDSVWEKSRSFLLSE